MELKILPLSPALAHPFCDYLSGLDFAGTPHWASCFCRYYYLSCTQQEWICRTLEENRAEALREIEAGNMRGYLAFDGETCIGWCNANDVKNLPRLAEYAAEFGLNSRVGCTICYVVHPDYRGKGVARKLLARAISDFRAAGYDAMLALPFESEAAPQKRYRGTRAMYEQAGFHEIRTEESVHVMRLDFSR